MKVVYITSRLPFPPHKGDQLISFNQLINLKRIDNNVRIYLITLYSSTEDLDKFKKYVGNEIEEIIHIPFSLTGAILSIFKTIINLLPFQVNYFGGSFNKRKMKVLINRIKPDIVHLQTVRTAFLVSYLKKKCISISIDLIDALSMNMLRRARNESFLLKFLFYIEYYLIKRFEQYIIGSSDFASVVSSEDKSFLGNNKVIVNRNGTSFGNRKVIQKKNKKTILFHGNMSYFPNNEAAQFLIFILWPKLQEKYPNIRLKIIGKDPSVQINRFHGVNNIEVLGYVEDIESEICKSTIAIYPMNSGSGMQNKIIEAMACGVPTIISELAAKGIDLYGKEGFFISNGVDDYVKYVSLLLEDKSVFDMICQKSYEFVRQNYSWKKNCLELLAGWKSALS